MGYTLTTLPEWLESKLKMRSMGYFKQKNNISNKIIERHSKSDILNIVLMFCYDEVFKNHGKLIPTINKEDSTFINPMGIMFTDEIDDDYLNEIESLFIDGSYEYKFYDYLRYFNIGNVDIKKIKNTYCNLNFSTIRDITLYSKNSSMRNMYFDYLNNQNSDFQKKFCKLITPISIELTNDLYINCDSEFVEITINLINGNKNSKEQIELAYEKINDLKENQFIKTKNIFYICEFEYFFQDLIINYLHNLDDEYLDTLLRIKDYSMNNIPSVTGKRWKEPIYKTISYEVDDSPFHDERECVTKETRDKTIIDGYKIKNSINFNEKIIYDEQKAIIEIFKMYVEKNIDYKKLLELNCPDTSNKLIDVINSKEKVKKKCK